MAKRWAAALQDPRPEVRAAAARAINVSGAAPLVDELRRALATEQDRDAAREEIVALAALGGKRADETLLAAARRLGPPGADMVASALARSRGPEALSSLPALRELGLNRYDTFLLWATRGGTQSLTAAASLALRDRDEAGWGAVVELARRSGATLDPGVLVAALTGTNDAIRAAACWHLALLSAGGHSFDGRVAAAAEAALDGDRPSDLSAALALELLGRTLGRKPVEQKARAPYAKTLE
jgi:hypothetical protein